MEQLNDFLSLVRKYNPRADLKLIKKAYQYAYVAHEPQKRKTGEPYFTHVRQVAVNVLKFGIPDTASICAAFLHDVAEDTQIGLRAIENEFTPEIEKLVEGLTKINKKFFDSIKEYEIENKRKILLATAKDPRIMLIKLCDRLDNMHSVAIFREEKQQRISQETLEMYAPIAEKIGASQLQAYLEDLSMRYLHAEEYDFLRKKIKQSREDREKFITSIAREVEGKLRAKKIPIISVRGRAKHFYSIYKKMQKKNKTFDQLRDLYGIRIVVKTSDACYAVNEELKKMWDHIALHFKDYIKHPRANGYKALHANFTVDSKVMEVQIRTKQMDAHAEYGAALHWKYKGTEKDKKFDQKLTWVREFVKWVALDKQKKGRELSIDVFRNQIIVVTPKGDPIILQEGSTPIDFAFAVHTRVGEHIKSAEVNGNQVALSTKLKSGDVINMHTVKKSTVQSQWLRIAHTNEAKAKIRKALGMPSEVISPKQAKKRKDQRQQDITMLVDLQHMKGIPKLKLSKCCNPQRGDRIVAFYTKDRKFITVHKADCPNQYALDQSRKITMSWSKEQKKGQTITILLDPQKSGLITSAMDILYTNKVNVRHVATKETKSKIKLIVDLDPISDDLFAKVDKELDAVHGISDIDAL